MTTPNKPQTVEEIVEELETQPEDWNTWSIERQIGYNLAIVPALSLLTTLTQAHQSELEEAVKAERERILGKQSLPDQLRETRLHLNLSQEEVGKRLGYSAMAISHFESGNRPIPEKVLGEFIMIFGSLVDTKANNRRGKAFEFEDQNKTK